ncbi:MAG TPA: bifunctional serine/threonine-protein kinase/formylglycine-generating enzyme family protein, partial [Pyrinomonadaceae bacterium]|nr:bifunctional serine/threonine-protein kinase/formylglycine-generating enzyme family protein [Pyrinomonadaceae bacterium]
MKECQLCKNCYTDDVATCPSDGMPTIHTIAGEPVLEGKYHLECRLGQGGMGVVYKARHAYLKTQLAIKIILPDLVGNDPQLVTRFRQEALAAAAIRHQNVVAVTDYGVVNGQLPFLVMEYVEGESLHDLLAREGSLHPERAVDLMAAICAGVGAAHHQGIVHRDLKPLNIMICSDKPNLSQAVKILDFGLAKIKSGELLGSFIQAQTTGLMGSPYYMAPEQWADDDPDSRSDIYSLGVMLYQMLAGDVPFKGSSIPAIMKKHVSDPAPRFSELGVTISPEIEAAVLHTLQKEKEQRTASVEVLINELREAVYPASIGINTGSGIGALPVARLSVHTRPAQSKVFVDNVSVGQSRDDGWLLLEGIQSGNHHLRVTHDGFQDWFGDVVCDGKPQQVVADLRSHGQISQRMSATGRPFVDTQNPANELQKTAVQGWGATGQQEIGVASQPPKKRSLSRILLGVGGLFLLFIFGVAGIAGAYFMGLIPKISGSGGNAVTASPSPSPAASQAVTTAKADMVQIPGGRFKMGRNGGPDNERPEHEVTVRPFSIDKTEVTNAEFLDFMNATGYRPPTGETFLAKWENNKPIRGEEMMPVRYVNVDDVNAFINWRNQRDGAKYRLPTEEEWEYVARNGEKGNLYPWGDKFDQECAALNRPSNDPAPVATKSCPNRWGVQDLIGNVFEWTS